MKSHKLSRRSFAGLLGAGAGAALLAPAIAARGWEERLALRAEERLEQVKRNPKDPADLILLNSNENPYGPFPAAMEALVAARSEAMRYPDYWGDAIQEKIAAYHGVDPESVVVTCGSTEVLKLAAQAFLTPSRRLVMAEPTFEAIAFYGKQTGAEIVKVPVTADYGHDLEAMARAAQERPGLIYLCNPNNPTATLTAKAAVQEFLGQVPRESVVLVDEAYFHYVEDPSYGTMLDAVAAGANVVVARTFSKVYGMAGLRLGYAIARKELMVQMRPHCVWDATNVMACQAALASFGDEAEEKRQRALNHQTRAWLVDEMKKRGHDCIPSHANFVCVHVAQPVRPVIEAFRQQGIAVGRPFAGLPEHIRVSIGLPEEMQKFVASLDKALEVAKTLPAQTTQAPERERNLGAAPLWARR
ncbi:MAG TPA: aminotransferase class I/II-fold pyridoxal phosphate-dependent enzyme [Candidatus Xenobia bacterium]|nr:aminotransferase class I/II-fold pyridoxal phosphate-dependent enzyme [Candidatus Xenobia bacterium]